MSLPPVVLIVFVLTLLIVAGPGIQAWFFPESYVKTYRWLRRFSLSDTASDTSDEEIVRFGRIVNSLGVIIIVVIFYIQVLSRL